MGDPQIPDREEFIKKLELYEKNEARRTVYFEALNHIAQNWNNPPGMAAGTRILLHSWHWNFYRFGDFDCTLLQNCLDRNLLDINSLRYRHISSLSVDDENKIKELFEQFLAALEGGKRKSPVAVAKALHLLAPDFFPLWDNDIALEYGYVWGGIANTLFAASDYVSFCHKMKEMAANMSNYVSHQDDRSLLKRIDEYNFAKFSKFAVGWQ